MTTELRQIRRTTSTFRRACHCPRCRCLSQHISVCNQTTTRLGASCTGASDSVVLTLDQNPVITIADVACTAADGGTELMLKAVVSAGGGPGTTFSWNGPSGGIISGAATDTITVGNPVCTPSPQLTEIPAARAKSRRTSAYARQMRVRDSTPNV